jgi:predicted ATPase
VCLHEKLAERPSEMRLRCFGLARLADAQIRQGEFDAALAIVGEGLSTAEQTGSRQWDAELHRLSGMALFHLNKLDEGQAALQDAIGIARRQQARAYELRATMGMTQLRRDQGKARQAHELLAPVYGWFTEGFETRDLKDAKALLNELAA